MIHNYQNIKWQPVIISIPNLTGTTKSTVINEGLSIFGPCGAQAKAKAESLGALGSW